MTKIIELEPGVHNHVHLCDSCCDEQPSCDPECLAFGTGAGRDNVVLCNCYEPLDFRNYARERDIPIKEQIK